VVGNGGRLGSAGDSDLRCCRRVENRGQSLHRRRRERTLRLVVVATDASSAAHRGGARAIDAQARGHSFFSRNERGRSLTAGPGRVGGLGQGRPIRSRSRQTVEHGPPLEGSVGPETDPPVSDGASLPLRPARVHGVGEADEEGLLPGRRLRKCLNPFPQPFLTGLFRW